MKESPNKSNPNAKEMVWLRGGIGKDYPCNDPNMVLCAASECQQEQRCQRKEPIKDFLLLADKEASDD